MTRWTTIITTLLSALTAGYAASAYSRFRPLIEPASDYPSFTRIITSISVAALAAGIAATVVLTRLPARAIAWLTVVAVVVVTGSAVVTSASTLTTWAGPIAVGILFACALRGRSSTAGQFAAAIGWIVAVTAGAQLDNLFASRSEFGWTTYDPSTTGPAVGRVIISLVLAALTLAALTASETRDRTKAVPAVVSRREVSVAVLLPIAVSAISAMPGPDRSQEWTWFASAAAMTLVIIAAALLFPHRSGQIIVAGLVVNASTLASVNNFSASDSWWVWGVPLAAVLTGAVLGIYRRSVYAPLVGIAALAIFYLVDGRDMGQALISVLQVLTSLFIGYLIASAAMESTVSAIAVTVPAIPLFALSFTVYSAGYGDNYADVTIKTVPDQTSMTITGACMLVAAAVTMFVVRRRPDSDLPSPRDSVAA